MKTPLAQLLLVVGDPGMVEVLGRALHPFGQTWKAHFCSSPAKALDLLGTIEMDMVIADVKMPDLDGIQLLQAIRSSERTEKVPVVILTGDGDTKLKRRALDLGATDLLNKPVNSEDLLARIRNTLLLKSYEEKIVSQGEMIDQLEKATPPELGAAQQNVVLRLARACEYRDDETGHHVLRVARFSNLMAKALGLDRTFSDLILLASPLHDIGKIGIPDSILLKEGPLSPEERLVIERHAVMGHEILSGEMKSRGSFDLNGLDHLFPGGGTDRHPLLEMAASIARGHHERWDGWGYPEGLEREAIPLEARIVALADVYDTLRSQRVYKPAYSEEKSMAIILEESGRHFDPEVVAAFSDIFEDVCRISNQLRSAGTKERAGA